MAWAVLVGILAGAAVCVVWFVADRGASRRRLAEAVEREGIRWDEVVAKASQGIGSLILDSAQGHAKGYGPQVVWWCDADLHEASEDEIHAALMRQARMTGCPTELLGVAALENEFPKVPVVENRRVLLELHEATPKEPAIRDATELLEVLREARELLSRPGNDFAWSHWDGPDAAAAEIDQLIAAAEAGDVAQVERSVIFAPTGPMQEVSLGGGWADEFLDLADRYDAALKKAAG